MQHANATARNKKAHFVGKSKGGYRRPRDPRFPIAVDRVAKRVDELQVAPTALATKAGLERVFITDLLEGRKKSVNGRERLEALAKALDCRPEWLTVSTRPSLPLWGGVGGTVPAARRPKVLPPPDPRFPASQGLLQVQDDHLTTVMAPLGSWLLVCDAEAYLAVEKGFKSGQLVVVVKHAAPTELMVRRVVMLPNGTELHPIDSGEVFCLGRDPVTVRGVVLKTIQEWA